MRDRESAPGGDTSPSEVGPSSSENVGPSSTDRRTEEPHPIFYCDLCGHVMLDLHCKLICEQCGYKRDCSDP